MKMLTAKDPAEVFAVAFDFSRLLADITGATVTAATISGPVDLGSNVIDGAATIDGLTVLQRIHAGVDGADYLLRCVASNGVETYVLAATLPVRAAS